MRKIKKMPEKIFLFSMMFILLVSGASTVKISAKANEQKTGYQKLEKIELEDINVRVSKEDMLQKKSYNSSKWDTYSSDYFVDQLNGLQQTLYNDVYNVCMQYLLTDLDAYNYTEYGLTEPIYGPTGLTEADAEEVVQLVLTNNPQFYFLSNVWGVGNYNSNSGVYVQIGMFSEWTSGTVRTEITKSMDATITSWVNQINAEVSIVEKEKKAHDLVVGNTEYTYTTYDQSCASVFLEGASVCAGYAEAFELLCNAVGINCIAVTSPEHEWNKVELYGEWYNVDCTWDDQSTIIYNYFNVNDSAINEGYHELEDIWNNLNAPECTKTEVAPIYNGIDYSAVYDEAFYKSTYSDLNNIYRTDSIGLLKHFVEYGMSEGRQAISTFNVWSYKNQYVDLRNVYGNDLKSYYMHYINYGKNEGRNGIGCTSRQGTVTVYAGVDYSSIFDYDYYVSLYSDIRSAFGADDVLALQHFVEYGMSEGRRGNSSFSVDSYRKQYADLRNAYGSDLKSYYMHYIFYGKSEGRKGTGCSTLQGAVTTYNGMDYSSVYDYNYYTQLYPDIKSTYGLDDKSVLKHFIEYGMAEARQGIATFNVNSYRKQYADLRWTFGTNLKAYYEHYINYGRAEGRSGTGCSTLQGALTVYDGIDYSSVYNYNYYISLYSDIKNTFGDDDVATLKHFVEYGMAEGRCASDEFNVQNYAGRYYDLQLAFGTDLKAYYMHYINYGKREGRTAR